MTGDLHLGESDFGSGRATGLVVTGMQDGDLEATEGSTRKVDRLSSGSSRYCGEINLLDRPTVEGESHLGDPPRDRSVLRLNKTYVIRRHRLSECDTPPLSTRIGEDPGSPCSVKISIEGAEGAIFRDEREGGSVAAGTHTRRSQVRCHRLGTETCSREQFDGSIGRVRPTGVLCCSLRRPGCRGDRVPAKSLLAIRISDDESGAIGRQCVEPCLFVGECSRIEHRAIGVE